MVREGDKQYQDQIRRYQNQLDISGAVNENRQNSWGDISNMGFALADFGMNKGTSSAPDFTKGFKYAGTGYTPKRFNSQTGKFE